jgi:hypothetical protein
LGILGSYALGLLIFLLCDYRGVNGGRERKPGVVDIVLWSKRVCLPVSV